MAKNTIPTRFETWRADSFKIPGFDSKIRRWKDIDGEIYKTKTQWNEAGYRVKADPVEAAFWIYTWMDKRHEYYTAVFTIEQCVQKKKATEAQLAALAKAQHQAERVAVWCAHCDQGIEESITRKQAEQWGKMICDHCYDKIEEIQRARKIIKSCVVLDTETTGLDIYKDEIVQIAVINQDGDTLLDTLVKPSPQGIIRMYTPGYRGQSAFDIHKISVDMLENAPTWAEVYPELRRVLKGQYLTIYNEGFDLPLIQNLSKNFPKLEYRGSRCIMHMGAAYVGDIRWERGDGWNEWHWSYRWQQLGGGHTALSDCRAALSWLKDMAENTDLDEYISSAQEAS